MVLLSRLFRSRGLHAVTTACCLLSGTIAAVLLFQDLFGSGNGGSGRVVAEALLVDGRVKRRGPATYLWNGIASGAKLRKRDSVQTSPESSIEIKFGNGNTLTVGENSLVVLDDTAGINLKFMRGTFTLHEAGAERKISAVEGQEPKSIELPFRPEIPQAGARYFVKELDGTEHQQVAFKWKWLKGATAGAYLQVSRDRLFRRVNLEKIPLDPGRDLKVVPLPPGNYYWRLGSNGVHTDPIRFDVVGVRALTGLTPVSGEKVHSSNAGAKFRWIVPAKKESAYSGGKHWIEMSLDREFTKAAKLEEVSLSHGEAFVVDLPIGHLYWRIVSAYGEISLESEGIGFEHLGRKRPSVTLLLPAANQASEFPGGPRFEWTLDGDADQFVFEVQEKKTSAIVQVQRSAQAFANWKDMKPGSYRWKVSAGDHNKLVAESPWRELTVLSGTIGTVSPGAKIVLDPAADQKLQFSWQGMALPTGREYYVEVSESEKFDSLVLQNSANTTTFDPAAPLKAGRYFWRVSERDPDGNIYRQSRLRTVEVTLPPPLSTPGEINPAPNHVFRGASAKRMAFRWAKVDFAKEYEFILMKGVDQVYKKTTKDLRVVLQGIKPGAYTWTVAAVDRWERRGNWLSPQDCTVDYGPRLAAPSVGAGLPAPRSRRRGGTR